MRRPAPSPCGSRSLIELRGVVRPHRGVSGRRDLGCGDGRASARLVARALAEDVGAGDVTSEATVPEERAGAGADRAESSPGSSSGSAPLPRRCASAGWRTSTTWSSRASGARSVPAEVALGERSRRGAAGRRAHRAQLPRPPLRGRDADGALRRGRRRHRRPHPRHAQDDARPARRWRRRRSRPAAGATTAWASTTRS